MNTTPRKLVYSKPFDYKTLDVDTTSRRVKVAIAAFGNIDRDGDVFAPTAFNNTIKQNGPQGTNEFWFLVDHYYSITKALGKFSELYVGTAGDELNKLIGVSNVVKTQLGNDTLEHYYNGNINQHSVSYTPINEGMRTEVIDNNQIKYNYIVEARGWEGSSVLWGANPETPMLTVGKQLFKSGGGIKAVSRLSKALKDGRYSDEFASLVQLQLKALEQYVAELENTVEVKQPSPELDVTTEVQKSGRDAVLSFLKRKELAEKIALLNNYKN